MALVLVTDATAEPVTSLSVRHHLRLSTSDTAAEDELLDGLIKSARVACENKTRRLCLPQTWKYTLDDFPSGTNAIELPWSPLSTSTADVVITYLDGSSADSTTYPGTAYTVDYESEPPRLYPKYGTYENEWPTNVWDERGAVRVQFKAGYPVTSGVGSSATAQTPDSIRIWIKMRVGALYENREALSQGSAGVNLPRTFVDGILDPYILPEVY